MTTLILVVTMIGALAGSLAPRTLYAAGDHVGQAAEDAGIDPMLAIRAALDDEFFDMAVDLLEGHLQTLPADDATLPSVLALLARAYHNLGRHTDVLERLETALPPECEDSDAQSELWYWRATAYHHLDRNQKVLELTQTFRTRFPDAEKMPEILKLRAAALTALDALDEALALYAEAVATYPENPRIEALRLAWAKTLILADRHDDALAKMETLSDDLSQQTARAAAYWRGRLAFREGNHSEARDLFRKLLETPGISGRELSRSGMAKAEVLEEQDQPEAAAEVLENMLDRLPPGGEPRRRVEIESARLLFALGRTEAAAERLYATIRADPRREDVPDLQLRLAYGLLRGEKPGRAADEFQIYLEAFTNRIGQAEALSGLGWSLLAMNRAAEAADRFEKAAQRFDSAEQRSEALFKAADAWFTHERFAAALERYRAAADAAATAGATQRVARARYMAAESMIRLEHYDEAINALAEVSEDFPDAPVAAKAFLRIAKLHEERDYFREALEVYEMISQRVSDPDVQADSFLSSGLILYTLFRFNDALEKFNRLLERFPENPRAEQARFMKVWSHSMTGREEEAIQAARRFLEYHPASSRTPEILFRLAEHRFNKNDLAEAQQQFSELASEYPESAMADDALLWAGRAAARRQNYTEAMDFFARLAADYPDSPRVAEARFSHADVLSALGEFSEAKVLFDDVIERFPTSYLRPPAIGRKGDCQFMLGNTDARYYDEAIRSYRRLLELDAASEDLRLQALYKIGRCYDHLDDKDMALEYFHATVVRFREKQHQGIRPTPAAVWGFQRAAFDAAAILESRRQWRQAVNMLQRVVDAGVPASAQAADRIQRLRDEHWMLVY